MQAGRRRTVAVAGRAVAAALRSGSVLGRRGREREEAGDDGGGMFIANALLAEVNIRNNMIVNNLAADLGGAIMLDDSSNVRIISITKKAETTPASAVLSKTT